MADETFRRLLTAYATLHENPVDGNSFYMSLSDFLQDGRDYIAIREVVYAHMMRSIDAYGHALEGDTRDEKLANLAVLFMDGVEPRGDHIHLASMIFNLRIVIFFPPNGRAVFNESEAFHTTLYLSFHNNAHFNRLSDIPDLPPDAGDLADDAFHLEGVGNLAQQLGMDTPPASENASIDENEIVEPQDPAEPLNVLAPEHPFRTETKAEFRRNLYNRFQVFHNRPDGNSFYASLAAFLPGGLNHVDLRELCVDYVRNNTDQFPSLFHKGDSEAEKKAIVEQMSAEGINAMECHVAAAAAIFNIRIVVYHAANCRTIQTVDGHDGTLHLARDEDYHYDMIMDGPESPNDAGDMDELALDESV